jgi:hypothetical protein
MRESKYSTYTCEMVAGLFDLFKGHEQTEQKTRVEIAWW